MHDFNEIINERKEEIYKQQGHYAVCPDFWKGYLSALDEAKRLFEVAMDYSDELKPYEH